jgi:hypothetical protein
MGRNKRTKPVSLLPETLERRAHIVSASPTSAPLLASLPIDTPEAIPADQREAFRFRLTRTIGNIRAIPQLA